MQAPGAEWLVILNDRQLWEGQIREHQHAARSRRPEQRSRRQHVSLTLLGRLVPQREPLDTDCGRRKRARLVNAGSIVSARGPVRGTALASGETSLTTVGLIA